MAARFFQKYIKIKEKERALGNLCSMLCPHGGEN